MDVKGQGEGGDQLNVSACVRVGVSAKRPEQFLLLRRYALTPIPLYGLFLLLAVSPARAATINAASCSTSDVQTAINQAAEGDTVTLPACPSGVSWTSGVTISGKGITLQGAGSGRILAYDDGVEMLTVATGALTVKVAGFSPGFSGASLMVGKTLRVFENNARSNWMQGTVTSYSGTSLVMNITSTGGSGSTHRWLIATVPTTVLINNSAAAMFSVTEDTSFHTQLSGFKIVQGAGTGSGVNFNGGGANGQAILLHDCWIEQPTGTGNGDGDAIHVGVNRGVIWNCSFDSTPFSMAPLAVHMQPYDTAAWSVPSFFGMNDSDGQHNLYVEDSDFHAFLNATDNDEGSRSVFRHNLFDNSGFGTHGVDSNPIGSRYFEFYGNSGVYNGYSDGTTFNMNWWFFLRGGTFVIHDNVLPLMQSQDYGTRSDLNMTVMNLQNTMGPNPCFGQGTSNGADWYAPHQVGIGYVTGTGHDGYGRSTYDTGSYGYGSLYVGDPEPGYAWNNARTAGGAYAAFSQVGTSQRTDGTCVNPDTSANYIKSGRDYFNTATTPKPGYTPYTYPHPLTQGTASCTPTAGHNYSTSFPLTENPISECGSWTGGQTVGLDWSNVQTIGGHATGLMLSGNGFNDSTAILGGAWGSLQTATATVYVNGTNNPGGEVELRLLSSLSAHRCVGYELDASVTGNGNLYFLWVRWDGAEGSFTYLANGNHSGSGTTCTYPTVCAGVAGIGVKNGDVMKATVDASGTLRGYINGVLIAQATDTTFASGAPGMGTDGPAGADLNWGFSDFSARDGTTGSSPNIILTKTSSIGTAKSGDTVTYTIAYQNTGTGAATNVVITDVIPTGTTLVAGTISAGGTLSGSTITWMIPTVSGSGGSGTVSFQVKVQ